MRVADYVAEKLYSVGVKDVFIVTGGGLMFMTDGLACNDNIRPIPCLHEQAAAMAAVAYAQYNNNYGACYVTTGCGGTNAVTGTLHAWQDNAPVVFVSGQCNRNEMISSAASPVRQIGIQEADIVSIVKSITKYAVTIMDPEKTVYHVEKALYLAKHGCPGPVWLDVPMDVQEAEIDPDKQEHYTPQPAKTSPTPEEIREVCQALESAERPFILVGSGVRMAGACEAMNRFLEKTRIPMGTTRLGLDIVPNALPYNCGVVDSRGHRSANFALNNADVVLVLGSRLGIRTSGYNYELFAHNARKIIVVDIDPDEHRKGTVRIDRFIQSDAGEFLKSLPELSLPELGRWREKCLHWKNKWPVFTPEHDDDSGGISEFAFCRALNGRLRRDSAVITSAGTPADIVMLSLKFSDVGQRYLGGDAQCEMGDELPAAIGASIAKGRGETLCIVGDGSLQMNIQELQTILTQKLPIKIFVWNNGGYASIRGHQRSVFHGRFLGVDPASGTVFPELKKIADAYGYPYFRADKLKELDECLDKVMAEDGAAICEVMCRLDDPFPMAKGKVARGDGARVPVPTEDMVPLLPREELEEEMEAEPYRWWELP
ncbi:MAG: thiamine pyrophosphate-binding protein [Oscillospiraceae bacterium]|jgi:acetolactate synthase-1/2/3 large subunit|nr:thiamine pyrophosphate-binding protein [Oscillospiraceae bacterium]